MSSASQRLSWMRGLLLEAVFFAVVGLRASANDLQPFDTGSLEQIRHANQGKPFILAFWSIDCGPCKEEMALLKSIHAKFPGVTIVLVSTDPPGAHAAVRKFLARYELGKIERWAFASEFGERLRYAVDRSWRGELPRSYLYDTAHRATGHSGLLDADTVIAWLKRETSGQNE